MQDANFKASDTIACYLAFKDEFQTNPIIEAIWQAKKQCYVPILKNDDTKILQFVRYEYGNALHLNRYGILEPKATNSSILPENLDMVIMPLLAFDSSGHRLGSGGGYYDRSFAFLLGKTLQKPVLFGLGYTAQEAPLLTPDPWDVRLRGVITEKSVRYF